MNYIIGGQALILFLVGWSNSFNFFNLGFLGNMLVGGFGTVLVFGALLALMPKLMLIVVTIIYGLFAWDLATNLGFSIYGIVLSVIGAGGAGFFANYLFINEIEAAQPAKAPSSSDSLSPPKDVRKLELSALEDLWRSILSLHEVDALSDKNRDRIFKKLQKTPNGIFLSETRKTKTPTHDEFYSSLVNELMEYGLVSSAEANKIEIKAQAADSRRKEQTERKDIAQKLYRLVGFRAIDADAYRNLVKQLDPNFPIEDMTDKVLLDIVGLHITKEPDDCDFKTVRALLDYKLINDEECRSIGLELKSLRRG